MWQSIPQGAYKKKVNLIIKFGMNLLKIDEKFSISHFYLFMEKNMVIL